MRQMDKGLWCRCLGFEASQQALCTFGLFVDGLVLVLKSRELCPFRDRILRQRLPYFRIEKSRPPLSGYDFHI